MNALINKYSKFNKCNENYLGFYLLKSIFALQIIYFKDQSLLGGFGLVWENPITKEINYNIFTIYDIQEFHSKTSKKKT